MLTTDFVTLGIIARRVGLPLWKVRRVFERGLLPEYGRVGNYRVVPVAAIPDVERALREAGYLPGGGGHAA